jgi:hypothetical protein
VVLSSGEGMGDTFCVVSVKRAVLSHWMFCSLVYQMMDEVQKPSNRVCPVLPVFISNGQWQLPVTCL